MIRRRLAAAFAAMLACLAAATADARPTYFSVFTNHYGFATGDRLYACGVCHYLWTGTGGRNPYGQAVEQQLYVGKSIAQSIIDVEGADTDGDGFTNGDEIINWLTLPGYSCSNFYDAIGAPNDYHTYITPMVASCLEPLDIRLSRDQVTFLTEAGEVATAAVEIFNNGRDFPLSITGIGLLPGSHAALSVVAPTPPFDIPVGDSVIAQIVFSPPGPVLGGGTLRVSSNDPDEPDLDVAISVIGFVQPVAPAEERAACLADVDQQFRRYAKKHLKAWNRCYLAEVNGLACDTGRRDLEIGQAEARFRLAIGGPKDKRCAGAMLTPGLLDMPDTCGGTCDTIPLTTMSRLADCLVCRQDEAMRTELTAGAGTAPPDLPPNTSGSTGAGRCQKSVLMAAEKGIDRMLKQLGRCELANVTAGVPVDCGTALAEELARQQAAVDKAPQRCTDTTGLMGCAFDEPTCMGTTARAISDVLTETVFGLEP